MCDCPRFRDLGSRLTQWFCPGASLQADLDRHLPVPAAEATIGALRLAAALSHSHAAGVLHGDVRPANVLRDSEGEWLLAEGGVAHAVHRAKPGATPLFDPTYAPRELLGWENPGPPADVYALGATLQAALCGKPASSASGISAALPAAVPVALTALLARMLAVDPADRPSLAEVDHILRAHVSAEFAARLPQPEPARTPAPAPRPRIRPADAEPVLVVANNRRRTLVVGATVAALFVVGAGAVVATNGEDDAPAAAPAPAAISSPDSAASSDLSRRETDLRDTCNLKPSRGTPGCASGPRVDRGLYPFLITSFEYEGRLAVIIEMTRQSPELRALKVESVAEDGTGPESSKLDRTGLQAVDVPVTHLVIFADEVSPRRCVRVTPVPRSADIQLKEDGRFVCVAQLPAIYDQLVQREAPRLMGRGGEASAGEGKKKPTPTESSAKEKLKST